MESVKEKIQQVKLLLEDIKSQLDLSLNNAIKTDKETQLDAIVKMADKFEKLNIEIPDEMRSLKFKLIQEIDQFDAAENLNKELQDVLMPYVNQKAAKEKRSKTTSTTKIKAPKQFGVKLTDLIGAKLIEPNTKITNTVEGQNYEAIITPNGKVKLAHNNSEFNSLSSAAKEIMGRPINGWVWWQIEDDSGKRDIDYYRQIFIRNGK